MIKLYQKIWEGHPQEKSKGFPVWPEICSYRPVDIICKNLRAEESGMGILRVAVVDADERYCREVCALLEQSHIPAAPLYSLEDLPGHLSREPVGVLIVDLDTLPIDNNFFRKLKKENPDLFILCLSSRTYHPDLQEAMGSHIYASLAKPCNPEELFYWLRTISET
jgi:DNA-binding NtrC family response regulator